MQMSIATFRFSSTTLTSPRHHATHIGFGAKTFIPETTILEIQETELTPAQHAFLENVPKKNKVNDKGTLKLTFTICMRSMFEKLGRQKN